MTTDEVRKQVIHFITPTVAADAGMSFEELRLFVSGGHLPTDAQLTRLARRIGLTR